MADHNDNDIGNVSDCSEDSSSTDVSRDSRCDKMGSRKRPKAETPGIPTSPVPNKLSPPVGGTGTVPIVRQRRAADARERDRTHSVNSAFVTLRTLIPTDPVDRKLSKIEVLRLATSYISHLHTILMAGMDCIEQPCLKHQTIMSRLDSNSRSVCTFCLSATKVKQMRQQESCMYKDMRSAGIRR